MKKTLTQNISRYDDKMRLRMDKKTAIAATISLSCALTIGIPLCMLSILIGMPAAVIVFIAAMLLQIGMIDGVPLLKMLRAMLNGNVKKEYLHNGTERYVQEKGTFVNEHTKAKKKTER